MIEENKSSMKNSVRRLIIAGIGVLIQIIWVVVLVMRLNQYSQIITLLTVTIELVLVLAVYSMDTNAAFKLPWIILITVAPIVGICVFFLFGRSGATKKVRARYRKIDQQLFAYLNQDEQIIEDVKNCVAAGRTPVVLSRYKDHSEKFYERLKSYADHVFLMTGNNSKKEHRKILEQMHQVDKNESLILIATGSLVGEGFDFPRLDTLFMATPVSFRGVVEQYAGRLNRDYAGKENVIIYDYVDNHIPMFNNMYMKRLKAYKQIGYEFGDGLQTVKQTVNAIYDGNNYSENYHKDLLDSNKNIIISSPVISGSKVYELINMLKEKQMSGVQVTIVTWTPDSYGFGDAAYWMQLHEDMRRAGFYIRTVEEYCDRFAVIDQEVVWYGNINLLAKDKVDDSIMRVRSKGIAGELMEITFRNNDGKAPEDYEN